MTLTGSLDLQSLNEQTERSKRSMILTQKTLLKGPSQPPPFSMPSTLLTLLGEAKLYCISVSCVPEGMFDYL